MNYLLRGKRTSVFSRPFLAPLTARFTQFPALLLLYCSICYSFQLKSSLKVETFKDKNTLTLSKTLVGMSAVMQTPVKVKNEATNRIVSVDGLDWIDLRIPPHELRPINTLTMGQCFNWKHVALLPTNDKVQGYWTGVLFSLPLLVRQLPHTTEVACLLELSSEDSSLLRENLLDYFQVKQSLLPLYDQWAQNCPRMKIIAKCLPGVRVVRQDPWECLVSFICSSNNNIARITLMLDRLRAKYGNYVCTLTLRRVAESENYELQLSKQDSNACQQHFSMLKSPAAMRDEAKALAKQDSKSTLKRKIAVKEEDHDEEDIQDLVVNSSQHEFHYYTFPRANDLAALSEEELRALGMGYRAKFIKESARIVESKVGGADGWFQKLRSSSFTAEEKELIAKQLKLEEGVNFNTRLAVQHCLLELNGVGRKVADCVALFSLDQIESVPVDTHVWDIAVRDYEPKLQERKSLTPSVYEEVGDVFRKLFLSHAGWAHSVLFAAELPGFRELLPLDIQQDMKEFAQQQKKLREEIKQQKKQKSIEKDQEESRVEVVKEEKATKMPKISSKSIKKEKKT